MNSFLQDLWYTYELQRFRPQDAEERELLSLIVRSEETLFANLNEEQKALLKKYKDSIRDLHCLSERDAFVRGVRFAAAFLTEALEK